MKTAKIVKAQLSLEQALQKRIQQTQAEYAWIKMQLNSSFGGINPIRLKPEQADKLHQASQLMKHNFPIAFNRQLECPITDAGVESTRKVNYPLKDQYGRFTGKVMQVTEGSRLHQQLIELHKNDE